jgi:hypothetical protein
MRGTIIKIASSGARVTAPLYGPPKLDQLKAAVGDGDIEMVPGFATIECEGKVVPCVVFCGKESKLKGQLINRDATILWDAALLRGGYPGLLKPDGRMADILFGQVAVVVGDAEFMTAPPSG